MDKFILKTAITNSAAAIKNASKLSKQTIPKFPKLKNNNKLVIPPASGLKISPSKRQAISDQADIIKKTSLENRSKLKAVSELNRLEAWFKEHPNTKPVNLTSVAWRQPNSDDTPPPDNEDCTEDENTTNPEEDAFKNQTPEFNPKYIPNPLNKKCEELYNKTIIDSGSAVLVFTKTIKVTKKVSKISFFEVSKIEKNEDYMSNILYIVARFARSSTHRCLVVDCRDFTEERDFLTNCKCVIGDYVRHRVIIR